MGDTKKERVAAMEQKLLAEAELERTGKMPEGHLEQQIDKCFKSDDKDIKSAIGSTMAGLCRHCLLAGRGIQRHNRFECKKKGNSPATPCKICFQMGKGKQFHWREDCPRN